MGLSSNLSSKISASQSDIPSEDFNKIPGDRDKNDISINMSISGCQSDVSSVKSFDLNNSSRPLSGRALRGRNMRNYGGAQKSKFF